MKARHVVLALALALLAGSKAFAQEVEIRSGEHPDYSRLVFETDAAQAWALGRGPDGYLLKFDNPDLRFDLGGVFDRMPRRRLADAALVAPGLVSLRVGTDAHVEAFELRPGVLVLDFRSGPAPNGSPFEAALLPPVSEPTSPPPQAPEPPQPTVLPAPPAPSLTAPQGDPATIAEPAPPPVQRTESAAIRLPIDLDLRSPLASATGMKPPAAMVEQMLEPEIPPAETDPRVAMMQSELMKQIGRATAQGLLEPAVDIPSVEASPASNEPHGDTTTPDHGTAEHGQAETPETEHHTPSDWRNMRVETSMDLGLDFPSGDDPIAADGTRCLSDSKFDLNGWGGDRTPGEVFAEKRAALLDMRDATDPAGAVGLAQAYIAFGFGAEARAVLNVAGTDTPDVPLLRELAAIVDNGQADNPELFDGQMSCPTRAALWAALARPVLGDLSDLDRTALLESFSELPIHIRRHLGPTLAERFLAAGDQATALQIRNAVARTGERGRTEDLTIVEAQIELARGADDKADRKIEEVVSSGGQGTADALALQIETGLGRGRVPSVDSLNLAESLAFERRGTASGTRLLTLAIRGHGARGDFETAFAMLAHHGLEAQTELSSELLEELAQRGSDEAFMREVYAGAMTLPKLSADSEARLAVADRLTKMGFPDRASAVLQPVKPRGTTPERLVRARLALAQARAGEAQQYLAGIETAEADELRAQIAKQQGNLQSAADYLGAAGDSEAQSAMAWRARDWNGVETLGAPEERAFVQTRREQEPAPISDEPSLAVARDALGASETMRDRLQAILNRPATQN
ncbi:hypothetical protein [Rhodovulum visakhapatnamense]|uniref:Uncharacterized protein n=1 Tax=Rhodovulum visakhapatnamense TaxID=364297 RepID=A0A4R8FMB3_9RHOB|nr:hypothetical protein [Rhodovulum visakhapatnamense]TDX24895.1 hypothetical protein EV657_12170 [Rhodovulum visakhapatnamense]